MSVSLVIILLFTLLLVLLLIPWRGAGSFSYQAPRKRYHEADAALSRRLLKPGSPEYVEYYREHPSVKEPDDRSRKAPGLLSKRSGYFHATTFAAAETQFDLLESLSGLTHENTFSKEPAGRGNPKKTPPLSTDPSLVPDFFENWLKMGGAHSVGFTQLKDYHLYSHKGRGPRSGVPLKKSHDHAIAITVEMDHRMMLSAPLGSSVMESSEQYLHAGILALKTAQMIRNLGYEATAHIDGHYEVICPLVAVDAGLGVIGRMGLLMTPRLGPRVRISVVTTNLPLTHSKAGPDPTTLYFCHYCRKCAVVCPANAIPFGPRTETDGTVRWQINSEKCYHYWTVSGTDCGRCISVCPYSHPDNAVHRLIRLGIKNNLLFRHMAIKLDHVFYGRKPPVRPLPRWADLTEQP